MPYSLKSYGLLETHAAVLLFGLSGLFAKWLSLPPSVIVLGRTFFAGIVLVLVLLYFRKSFQIHSKRDGILFALSGAVLALHWSTFFHAIQLSSVAVGLLTFSTFPIFITFMEPYFFNETIRRFDVVTAICVFIGLVLVIPDFDFENDVTQGALWGTLSGLTFAILALINKKIVQTHSPILVAAYQNIVATSVLWPMAESMPWSHGMREMLLLVVLGVLCTALSHALFIRGLSQIKAQLASIIACLEPVYGILLAILFLREIPTWRTLLGGAIILGTIVMATVYTHKPTQTAV
ncbi:MAG: EamA family transporter [SAR324 cluster bacterium]|nr:EamA family transporter [SAR324 cluster bacterium]